MDIKNINQQDVLAQLALDKPGSRVNAQAGNSQEAFVPGSDTVSVSEEGMLRTEAYRTAMNTSDIRQDKVNALKAQVANGTYAINAKSIAAGLLKDEALFS